MFGERKIKQYTDVNKMTHTNAYKSDIIKKQYNNRKIKC